MVVEGLVDLLGLRDGETRGHVRRVGAIVRIIGFELARRHSLPGMDEAFVEDIARVAPLHDVGKAAVPDAIFLKPGALDAAERLAMTEHAKAGRLFFEQLIEEVGPDPNLVLAAVIAGSHHERWDGCGYPEGLAGEGIPAAARLTAVADVYDVYRSARPYKAAHGPADAADFIASEAGAMFDAEIVSAFLASRNPIEALYQSDPEPG